jgi:hypothetical protein
MYLPTACALQYKWTSARPGGSSPRHYTIFSRARKGRLGRIWTGHSGLRVTDCDGGENGEEDEAAAVDEALLAGGGTFADVGAIGAGGVSACMSAYAAEGNDDVAESAAMWEGMNAAETSMRSVRDDSRKTI